MPRGTPNSETPDAIPMDGVQSILNDDPDALVQGMTAAPKSIGAGKFIAVLTGDMKLLIVHQRMSGRYKVYQERPAAQVATNVSQLPKGTNAA